LHFACSYGDTKSLKILLASRANVNVKSIVKYLYIVIIFNLQGGDVPLMKAINFNNVECVQLLLRFGANPKMANNVKYKIIFRVIIAQ
jgi:ankyrin repeat protein